jgi:WD40 repeat protein
MTNQRAATAAVLTCGILAAGLFAVPARADGGKLAESEVQKLGTLPLREARDVVLSDDGTRLACVLRRGNRCAVVVDGREEGEFDSVGGLALSPNGRHAAFSAERDNVWFVVIDGKETQRYAAVRGPVFSPDGKHLAYGASLGPDDSFVVCDGVPRAKYTAVLQEPPVFSPDGRRLAYEARTSGLSKHATVRDPNRTPNPNEPPPSWVTPDGQEVDVAASSVPRTHFIVLDEKKGERCNDVRTPVFSPDGRSLACAVHFGSKWFMTCDGKVVSMLYDDVSGPVFSGDGGKLAYAARFQDKWFAVVGKSRQESFDDVRLLVFSPDGGRLAYAALEGKSWRVVCGEKKSPTYDEVDWVAFSPDGKHLAFTARRNRQWMTVCDGIEGPPHQRVFTPKDAARSAGKLSYVTVDADEARRVEVNWPAGTDWTNGLK